MRLWTLHPRYLDSRGLVAVWREALLAQAVLRGRKQGYRKHPQLAYEWSHLMGKLEDRDPERFATLSSLRRPRPHPLFRVVTGGVENWERVVEQPPNKRLHPTAGARRAERSVG